MDEVTLQCAALEEELDKAKRLNQSKMLERDQAMAECKEVCILYVSYSILFCVHRALLVQVLVRVY